MLSLSRPAVGWYSPELIIAGLAMRGQTNAKQRSRVTPPPPTPGTTAKLETPNRASNNQGES